MTKREAFVLARHAAEYLYLEYGVSDRGILRAINLLDFASKPGWRGL